MANGNFAGGNGTASNPYLIEDAFDLDAMRNNLSAHYELISDIDLDISPFNEGEGWEPIGNNSSSSERFTGTFNGNGYIIKSLFFNRPNTNHQSLFGFTVGAEIKNVGLEDVDLTGNQHTGGLVGYATTSTTIKNSYSTGNVTGNSNTGGLVGYATSSTIQNSYSTGEVTGDTHTGGLLGYAQASSNIKNSYSTGNVTGNNYTGGLVGWASSSTIQNSYSIGKVTGDNYTGGLVGLSSASTIQNSYSIGKVTGDNYTGGLVGYTQSSSVIQNSFWDKESSSQNSSADGGTGLTTAEMQNPQTFINAGWDQELNNQGKPLWVFEDNQYPKLFFEFISNLLIYSYNSYYYYNEGNWVECGYSESDFMKFGMQESQLKNIPKKAWLEIKEPIIHYYTDIPNKREAIFTIETEAYTIYDEFDDNLKVLLYSDKKDVDPKLEVIANYSPLDEFYGKFKLVSLSQSKEIYLNYNMSSHEQIIFGEEDFDIRYVTSFLLDADQRHESLLKIIVSSDKGKTWKGFQNINPNNSEDIKKYGFNVNDLISLTEEEIKDLSLNGKLRIGFYIRELNSNDVTLINSLTTKEKLGDPKTFYSIDDGNNWIEIKTDTVNNIETEYEGLDLRLKIILNNGQELYGMSYSWT